jgi:hypothetical protein
MAAPRKQFDDPRFEKKICQAQVSKGPRDSKEKSKPRRRCPNRPQRESEYRERKPASRVRSQQFIASGLQQLTILNTGGTYLLAGTAAKTAVYVFAKCFRSIWQSIFRNCTHQVESAARSVIFVARDYVGWTSFEAKPAVDAREEFVFLVSQSGFQFVVGQRFVRSRTESCFAWVRVIRGSSLSRQNTIHEITRIDAKNKPSTQWLLHHFSSDQSLPNVSLSSLQS